MFIQRHRVAVAGIIAAAAVAVPAAALAAGSGSPTAKPAPPQATATAKPAPVSSQEAAAEASKSAAAARSQPAPVSSQEAAAEASKSAAAGSQPDSNGPAAVSALAARLGVSTDLAGDAFKHITALTTQGGRLDTTSAAFAEIARQLGVSPAQLAAAWNAVS